MSDQGAVGIEPANEWLSTRVLEHVRALRKESPETADRVLKMVEDRLRHVREIDLDQHRHRRRLEWAWFGFRVFMALLGFGALAVYAVVAVRLIEAGASVQAGVALGAGAASVVAIFVTGRAAGPLFTRRERDQRAEP